MDSMQHINSACIVQFTFIVIVNIHKVIWCELKIQKKEVSTHQEIYGNITFLSPAKLREGNVFKGVCHSVHREIG